MCGLMYVRNVGQLSYVFGDWLWHHPPLYQRSSRLSNRLKFLFSCLISFHAPILPLKPYNIKLNRKNYCEEKRYNIRLSTWFCEFCYLITSIAPISSELFIPSIYLKLLYYLFHPYDPNFLIFHISIASLSLFQLYDPSFYILHSIHII